MTSFLRNNFSNNLCEIGLSILCNHCPRSQEQTQWKLQGTWSCLPVDLKGDFSEIPNLHCTYEGYLFHFLQWEKGWGRQRAERKRARVKLREGEGETLSERQSARLKGRKSATTGTANQLLLLKQPRHFIFCFRAYADISGHRFQSIRFGDEYLALTSQQQLSH